MADCNPKLKLLYVMEILLEQTDAQHTLTAQDICDRIRANWGYHVERRGIYSDIAILQDYGIDIIQNKGTNPGYYVGSREFELAELKLLVDSVQSSKFITKRKSDELIKKLEHLTSKYNGDQLQRQVYIYNRIKADNETIYYNVDKIHSAIYQNREIRFQYAEWTAAKKLQLRRDGAFYQVSPWALTWDDEYYYLVAYEESSDMIKYFRVDKMRRMEITEKVRSGGALFHNFDLGVFSKKTFNMFQGEETSITMICENRFAGVVIDRFGQDVFLIPEDAEHFRFTATVAMSDQFFGWLTGVGNHIKIKAPDTARCAYQNYLQNILNTYDERG